MPPPGQPRDPPRVVLRGDAAALHDALAGAPGEFARALDGLTRGPGPVVCEIAIVAGNLAALPRIVELALARGVARCELVVQDDARDLVPLAELAPAVAEALTRCRAAGVAATVHGVPPCLLPDDARPAAARPAPAGATCLFAAVCDLSERCPQLSRAHVDRFGWEERRVRPVPRTRPWPAPARAVSPAHPDWLALLGPAAAAVDGVVLGRRAARYTVRLGGGATLVLELTPRDERAPRFARSRSFDIRYTRVEGPAEPAAIARALAPIVAAIVARDDGSLDLDPRAGLAPLPPR